MHVLAINFFQTGPCPFALAPPDSLRLSPPSKMGAFSCLPPRGRWRVASEGVTLLTSLGEPAALH